MNCQGDRTPISITVLSEVAEGLHSLVATGQTQTIFLNKMPLNQADRVFIRDILGQGTTVITSKGGVQPSEWVESGVPGVWFGVYYDSKGGPMLETLEITYFPTFAAAQQDDIDSGIKQLREQLQALAMDAAV